MFDGPSDRQTAELPPCYLSDVEARMTKQEKALCEMLFNQDGHMNVLAGKGGVKAIQRTLDEWPDNLLELMAVRVAKERQRRREGK